MSKAKAAGKKQSKAGDTEAKVVALAEQLGWFMGTVRAKADGWLESDALRKEITRIRDGATALLQHVDAASRSARIAVAKPKAAPPAPVQAARPSRGAVDAPGKRHRKPPPQEHLDKRMGEPVGKQMGQKSFQVGKSRGRG